jgi:hypothetical protein
MVDKKNKDERFFSIELKSKTSLKNVALTNALNENVLVEGTVGQLERAEFAEGVILQIVGNKGVLRIDLSENEITRKKAEEA